MTRSRRSGRPVSEVWWLLWLVPVIAQIGVVSQRYLNPDVAWYCYMAGQWLDGARLYREVVDPNPPAIVLLSVPPVQFARLLSLPIDFAMFAYTLGLAVLSLSACRSLVALAWHDRGTAERGLLMTGLVVVTFPMSGSEFGQREHLGLVLAWPYIFSVAVRLSGMPLSAPFALAAGVAAGVGLLLKPHQLLVLVVLEAAVFWRQGRLAVRPELLGASAAACSVVAASFLLFPEYLDIAGIVRHLYGGLNSELSTLIQTPAVAVWIMAAGMLVLAQHRASAVTIVAAVAATGALVGGLLQLKGWYYQMYPALALAVMSLLGGLVDVLRVSPRIRQRFYTTAVAAIVAMTAIWGVRAATRLKARASSDPLAAMLALAREHPAPAPVYVLGMTLQPGVPLMTYSNRPWAGRHNSLWFITGLYADELAVQAPELQWRTPAEMSALEQRLFHEVIGDLCASPPGVLAVQTAPHRGRAGHKRVDLLAYYRQSPQFDALVRGYREVGAVGAFTVFAPREGAVSCGPSGPSESGSAAVVANPDVAKRRTS